MGRAPEREGAFTLEQNKMANFSDDELFQVEQIIQQRKRKGVLEYLVRWKEGGTGSETWEPADRIKKDCPPAVSFFEKGLQSRSKRSSSRSRRSSASRSRSRSSSRSRKATQTRRKKTTRSRSSGRKSDSPAKKGVEETKSESKDTLSDSKSSGEPIRKQKENTVQQEETKIVQATETIMEKKEESTLQSTSTRVLRSSTRAERNHAELEVQRVHNEQRPVRSDDKIPRSAIWKVADYAVIVLFVISALAALVMFVDKFVDLGEFKKKAFPSLTLLQTRLAHGWDMLLDFLSTLYGKLADFVTEGLVAFNGLFKRSADAPPTPTKQ